ncbi:general secretion pathway protein C [Serpentinimonas maccroryi]|uniref:general secretion pathway protein C n=1 Tax=Serpentinimonas maccroryi TaxID=1458426 RepID=UPI0020340360|nr:general secretion pathway protein C [Serpentinimonas maccroryi]MCM2478157.1 general secretion pathway protein C [Serpentinimonas maccroryi]
MKPLLRIQGLGLLWASSAFLVWALVGLSLAYWASPWWQPSPVPPPPAAAPAVPVQAEQVARALGAMAAAPNLAAQGEPLSAATALQLLGVASDGQGRGVALLAEAGQPARALRVGQALPDGWMLQSLTATEAVLAAPAGQSGERRLALPKSQ